MQIFSFQLNNVWVNILPVFFGKTQLLFNNINKYHQGESTLKTSFCVAKQKKCSSIYFPLKRQGGNPPKK